jgi:hypothetical protein
MQSVAGRVSSTHDPTQRESALLEVYWLFIQIVSDTLPADCASLIVIDFLLIREAIRRILASIKWSLKECLASETISQRKIDKFIASLSSHTLLSLYSGSKQIRIEIIDTETHRFPPFGKHDDWFVRNEAATESERKLCQGHRGKKHQVSILIAEEVVFSVYRKRPKVRFNYDSDDVHTTLQ